MNNKILLELKRDEDGYPPDRWESLWADTLEDHLYRVDNIPFYVKGISSGDVISAELIDGQLVFRGLVRPSGNSVLRLYIFQADDVPAARKEFNSLGCESELLNVQRLFAVEIPAGIAFAPIARLVQEGVGRDRWDYEIGVIRQPGKWMTEPTSEFHSLFNCAQPCLISLVSGSSQLPQNLKKAPSPSRPIAHLSHAFMPKLAPIQRNHQTQPTRMRRIFLHLALTTLLLSTSAHAAETPAERIANQYAIHELAQAPPDGNLPDYTLAPADLAKAQHLAAIHRKTRFADELWAILQLLLLLQLGFIARMRDCALRLSHNRWLQGYTFAFLLLLATSLLNLPLALFRHHLGLTYGLSIQHWPGWFLDQTKSFLLTWLIGGLLLMLLFWIIRKLPRLWWLAFWACTIPLSIAGLFLMPYIEPLFFHYEPLTQSHPELVQRLEQVVAKGAMNIPPGRMFLMQASSKLTTLNADVEGFGPSKRVVVWDTAIQKLTPDGILFVFGHESGHYVLGHIIRGLLLSFIGSFLLLFSAFFFLRYLLRCFGPRWRIPGQEDWATAAVLLLLFTAFTTLLEPVDAAISRSQEHAADIYGQEAIHGLVPDPQTTAQTAFDVLGATSFDDPNPPLWFERWTYDHPSIGRRAAFAHAYNPWLPNLAPKYVQPNP